MRHNNSLENVETEGLDKIKAIVIGASAGGIDALKKILPFLPKTYPLPIIIVLHIRADEPSYLSQIFATETGLLVKDADEKESVQSGTIYFAPPSYHLLIERDLTFSLSTEEPVKYSRPSIDVLFESAADAFGANLLGIILTGANSDGAEGLKRIRQRGGLAIIQDPESAQARSMPDAACEAVGSSNAKVLALDEIKDFLLGIIPDWLEEEKSTSESSSAKGAIA